jgi:hypothetical protein
MQKFPRSERLRPKVGTLCFPQSPHAFDDALFIGWAAVLPQIDDIGRSKPAIATVPERWVCLAASIFLRQDHPLPEGFNTSTLLHLTYHYREQENQRKKEKEKKRKREKEKKRKRE